MSVTADLFPVESLDRDVSRWDEHLADLTPVEDRAGLLYKREDYFAPLGYGGINGSKLRQLVWLVSQYVKEGGTSGLITGASVLSPQLPMAALVARHYGLRSTIVLGATNPDSAGRHENVAIAARAGARFIFTPVGFNPALQRQVDEISRTSVHRADYKLCYGITTPEAADRLEVEAFHRVGAWQTRNIPEGVRTLIMTAGSCNTCVSVLYGLADQRPKSLERVVLVGIGPTRLDWIERRLETIEDVRLLPLRSTYRRRYLDHYDVQEEHQTDGPVVVEHHDLHARGAVTYQDKVPWSQDGIDFHPTYEGKLMRYLNQDHPELFPRDGTTLLWIVGSRPSAVAMQDAFVRDGLL